MPNNQMCKSGLNTTLNYLCNSLHIVLRCHSFELDNLDIIKCSHS